MKTSNNGITLIKKFEGCKLFAYKCLKSERFYTIGYGHYGGNDEREQTLNQLLSEMDGFDTSKGLVDYP